MKEVSSGSSLESKSIEKSLHFAYPINYVYLLVAVVLVSFKILLIPTYRSTDFEVHRYLYILCIISIDFSISYIYYCWKELACTYLFTATEPVVFWKYIRMDFRLPSIVCVFWMDACPSGSLLGSRNAEGITCNNYLPKHLWSSSLYIIRWKI